MTAGIVIVLFMLICGCSYIRTRSIVHPAVIVSGVWAILLSVYNLAGHDLYPLSNKFYVAISLWVTSFCVASHIPLRIKMDFPPLLMAHDPKPRTFAVVFYTMLLVNVYQIYRLVSITGGASFYMFFEAGEEKPFDLRVISYLNKLSLVVLICTMLFRTSVNKIAKVVFFLVMSVCSLIASNKTTLFQIFFAAMFALYYKGKLSVKKTIAMVALISAMVVGVTTFRGNYSEKGKTFNTARFLTTYVLSPLPAFDMVLQEEVNYPPGRTFRLFNVLLAPTGMTKAPDDDLDMWVEVPVRTNAYTVMMSFFVDYGYGGILVFGSLVGFFWGILYKGIQYGVSQLVLLYAVFFYSLPLQFFANYIFASLSVTIQIFIIVHLLFVRYSLKSKHLCM